MLKKLQNEMRRRRITSYALPITDQFMNPSYRLREVTGFSGSAGYAFI